MIAVWGRRTGANVSFANLRSCGILFPPFMDPPDVPRATPIDNFGALDLPFDVPNHVSYIQSWIKVLKSDTHELFRAAADASRIADWILSHHPDHAESRDPASEDEPSAPTEALAA